MDSILGSPFSPKPIQQLLVSESANASFDPHFKDEEAGAHGNEME